MPKNNSKLIMLSLLVAFQATHSSVLTNPEKRAKIEPTEASEFYTEANQYELVNSTEEYTYDDTVYEVDEKLMPQYEQESYDVRDLTYDKKTGTMVWIEEVDEQMDRKKEMNVLVDDFFGPNYDSREINRQVLVLFGLFGCLGFVGVMLNKKCCRKGQN